MENYYELLEVSKNASDEVISKVFKYHIKKNHPDLFSEKEKIQAEIKVKKLNEAYEVLSNSEKRKEYDKMLLEQENSRNTTTEDIINNLNICNNVLASDATYVIAAALSMLLTPFWPISSVKFKVFNCSIALFDALNSTGKVTSWNNNIAPNIIRPNIANLKVPNNKPINITT